jgi:hypothetical protein
MIISGSLLVAFRLRTYRVKRRTDARYDLVNGRRRNDERRANRDDVAHVPNEDAFVAA